MSYSDEEELYDWRCRIEAVLDKIEENTRKQKPTGIDVVVAAAEEVFRESSYLGRHDKAAKLAEAITSIKKAHHED